MLGDYTNPIKRYKKHKERIENLVNDIGNYLVLEDNIRDADSEIEEMTNQHTFKKLLKEYSRLEKSLDRYNTWNEDDGERYKLSLIKGAIIYYIINHTNLTKKGKRTKTSQAYFGIDLNAFVDFITSIGKEFKTTSTANYKEVLRKIQGSGYKSWKQAISEISANEAKAIASHIYKIAERKSFSKTAGEDKNSFYLSRIDVEIENKE